jgi:hypothetical protein
MQFVKEGLIEYHGIVINTLASYFESFTIKTAARKAVILIKILYVFKFEVNFMFLNSKLLCLKVLFLYLDDMYSMWGDNR